MKKCMIVAGILVVAGLLLMLIGGVTTIGREDSYDTILSRVFYTVDAYGSPTTRTETFPADTSRIEIGTVSDDIIVAVGDVDVITVIVTENYDGEYKMSRRGDTLNVEWNAPKRRFWFLRFEFWSASRLFQRGTHPVEVIVPRGYEGRHLKLETVSGDLNISDIGVTGDLNTNTVSGQITLSGATTGGGAHLGTVSGDVRWTGGACRQLRYEGVSGSLRTDGVDFTDAKLDSVSGDIQLLRVTGPESDWYVRHTTISGSLSFNGKHLGGGKPYTYGSSSAPRRIEANTVSGRLVVEE